MDLEAKTFSHDDQMRFARLSGDINPLHMDAAAARRTQMGAPIVHGIHGVLWALDQVCRAEPLAIKAMKVTFTGPIYVGDTAAVVIGKRSEDQLRLQVRVDGAPATSITLDLGAAEPPALDLAAGPVSPAGWPDAPLDLDIDQMRQQRGAFEFARPSAEATEAFPALTGRIGPERVQAIIALSRVVGMICPGLHSIFSGFTLKAIEPGAEPGLRFATSEVDDRFSIVRVAVAGGGIEGEVSTVARARPVAQPTIEQIAGLVSKDAFAGAVVLVVGGSRGLGEVTAKACAAGGAHVLITYARGAAEAEKVAAEITAFGGRCDVLPFDVRGDIAGQLAGLPAAPSHLYYYATGPIAQRRTRLMSREVLADFMHFYTVAFMETVEALLLGRPQGVRAFYPSSVAVAEVPKGWLEYAMAKAAGEIMCREMTANLAGAHVVCERLPRILTDQTSTTARGVEAAPILDVILPIVRDLQSA